MLNFNMRNPTIKETITHITPEIHGDMICLQLECGNSTGHLVPLCLSFLYNVVDFRPVNLIGYCAIDNQDGFIHLKGKEIAESSWLILSTYTGLFQVYPVSICMLETARGMGRSLRFIPLFFCKNLHGL